MQAAVGRAVRRVPWQANCLDQALAAQVMLRLRRRPGTAIIGLRRTDGWDAHAWLVGQHRHRGRRTGKRRVHGRQRVPADPSGRGRKRLSSTRPCSIPAFSPGSFGVTSRGRSW